MKFLTEPLARNIDINSNDRIRVHLKILSQKKMIRDVFSEFHQRMIDFTEKYISAKGLKIELGAGVYPLKITDQNVISSDIVAAEHLDRVIDAQNMDLEDDSVSVIYGQNCFHHFPNPENFFKEASRVLKKGGGIILIEPHYGFFAEFIYKRLFSIEGYDKNYPSWGYLNQDLPNQALSYICFNRDYKKFNDLFPDLEIVTIEPSINWLRYLLSGGLNFRQLVPNFMVFILKFIERLLKGLSSEIALHCYFVLRKK